MTVAAPAWLQAALKSCGSEAPPGHRFRIYLDGWDPSFSQDKAKSELKDGLKNLADTAGEWSGVREHLRAREAVLTERLEAVDRDRVLVVHGQSTGPFLTGVGNEHPLENGMTFLDPHGLPVLPGSSVKGTLRRAAEELALFETGSGWNPLLVWRLFGFDGKSTYLSSPGKGKKASPREEEAAEWRKAFEGWLQGIDDSLVTDITAYFKEILPRNTKTLDGFEEELRTRNAAGSRAQIQSFMDHVHVRGELEFWDVIPEPTRKSGSRPTSGLKVDVFTPHFPEYYGKGKAPTDDQGPQPLSLLVLEPDHRFRFTVTRSRWVRKLPVIEDWKDLVEEAFGQAFAWLGFGAKTSQGFGRLVRDVEARRLEEETQQIARQVRERKAREREEARRVQQDQARLEAMGPLDRYLHELELEFRTQQGSTRGDAGRLTGFFDRVNTEFAGPDQERAARKFREVCQALKLWSKKDCSSKQIKKVRAIKKILGED